MGTSIGQFLSANSKRPTSDVGDNPKVGIMDGVLAEGNSQDAKYNATIDANQAPTDSARAQQILDLAERTGLDHGIVDRNLDSIKTKVWRDDFAPARAAQGSVLQGWLSENPHHLPAVQKDLSKLNWLERYTKNINDQFQAGVNTVRLQNLSQKDFMGTITPREAEELKYLVNNPAPAADEYGYVGAGLAGIPGVGHAAQFLMGVPAAVANQIPIQGETMLGGGLKGAAIGSAVGATAGLLGGPFAEVTVPEGAALGARLGAWASVGLESAKMEAFTSYPEMKALKDEHGNTISPLISKTASLLYGAAAGAVEMLELSQLTKYVPGLKALGKNQVKAALVQPSFRRFLAGVGKDLVGTSAWEGGTEGVQQLMQNSAGVIGQMIADKSFDQLSTPDLMQRLFAGVGQSIERGAQAGIGGDLIAHGVSLRSHVQEIQAAQRAQKFYEAIGDATKGTDIATKLPGHLQEIVKRMVADGPVEKVYAPLETWNSYWQSQNVDPAEMAAAVSGSPDAYAQAVAQGSDIEIPTDRYAATLAPTEHNGFFSGELRHRPDAMNGREMKAAVKQLEDQAAEAKPTEPAVVDTQAQQFEDHLTTMLEGTGVYDAEASRLAVKTLLGNNFRALASRPDVQLPHNMAMLKNVFEHTLIRRAVMHTVDAVRPLATEARRASGGRRKVHNVATDGLIAELASLDIKQNDAMKRSVYRSVEADVSGTQYGVVIQAATRRGAGPTEQAKAFKNLVDYQRIREQVYEELKARGMSEDEINSAVMNHAENQAMLKAEHPEEINAEDQADLPDWAKEIADDVSFDPAEFNQSAWHGSPHIFDRFDLQKIGSGEGATAYGWGLYFASRKEVAEYYRTVLSGGFSKPNLDLFGSPAGLYETRDGEFLLNGRPVSEADYRAAYASALQEYEAQPTKGRVYQVDIPDDNTMLHWDKPLAQQSDAVRAALKAVYANADPADEEYDAEERGAMTYIRLENILGSPEKASRALAAVGITGISYPADALAKGGHEKSRNYVIFDDKLIHIKDYYQGQRAGDRLAVLHNLHPDQLLFADKIGGLAAPSLGVVPEGMSYGNMGSITLIGRQQLADPAEGVPVYDSDVWSQTFPKPEYKKAKVAKRDALLKSLAPFFHKLHDTSSEYQIDESLNRANPAEAIQRMLRSVGVQAAYLKEKFGIDIEPSMRPAVLSSGISDTQAMRDFAAAGGNFDPSYDDVDGRKALAVAVNKAVDEYAARHPDIETELRDAELHHLMDDEGLVAFAKQTGLRNDAAKVGTEEIDTYATQDRVAGMLKGQESEFKDWVESKVMPMHGDALLTIGRKKVPFTLDNIVEHMTRGETRAAQEHMTFGEGKARAASARRITSLQEMRNRAEYQIGTEAEIKAKREETQALMSEFRDLVVPFYRYSDTWDALDSSMKAVSKFAKNYLRTGATVQAMAAALRAEHFDNVTPDVARKGVEAALAMLEAPVPYFEAKPQRSVMLDEFAGAVVPKSLLTPELSMVFARHGIEARTYDDSERDAMGADGEPSSHQEARAQAVADLQKELSAKGERVLFQSAWHGSPHRFDEFSLEKIGTGEGHNAYGWGLYFAGKRSVGEYYREQLATSGREFEALTLQENAAIPEHVARMVSRGDYLGAGSAENYVRSVLATYEHDLRGDEEMLRDRKLQQPWLVEDRIAYTKLGIAALQKLIESGNYKSAEPGRLYHVDLPDDETYLLWDKPLADQPEPVKEAIRKTGYGDMIGHIKYPTPAQAKKILYSRYSDQDIQSDIGLRASWYDGRQRFEEWQRLRDERVKDGAKTESGFEQDAHERFNEWFARKGYGLFTSGLHTSRMGDHFYETMMSERQRAEGHTVFDLNAMKKAASLFLRDHGITGIKYLDGGSRRFGNGTYNYVVFDDRQVSIREYFQSPAPNDMGWSEIPSAPFKAYSALERAIGTAPFEKGTPEQWLAVMKKGVSQNERTATGIEEFLTEKQKSNAKTLTRAEVLKYAQLNRIALGAEELGAGGAQALEEATREVTRLTVELENARQAVLAMGVQSVDLNFIARDRAEVEQRLKMNGVFGVNDMMVDRVEHYREVTRQRHLAEHERRVIEKSAPAYEEYTEPGGSNYRIAAVTMPLRHNAPKIAQGEELPTGWTMEERDPNDWVAYDSRGAIVTVGSSRENLLEEVRSMVDNPDDETLAETDAVFQSGHDLPPNTLVHIRYKDRVLPSGERVLFVEEIQSDWHQQGRKRGYESPLTKSASAEMDALVEENANLFAQWKKAFDEHDLAAADRLNAQRNRNSLRIQELRTKVTGIPDAPFKQTSEWVELALKRVLSDAVRGNYDSIAWTTGDQQARRYNKYYTALEYSPHSNLLTIYTGNEFEDTPREVEVTPDKLADYIGQEATDALLDAPMRDKENNGLEPDPADRVHWLDTQGMNLGAKGMRGFYDKIVPQTLEKLLKKLGVKESGIGTTNIFYPAPLLSGAGNIDDLDEDEYDEAVRDAQADGSERTNQSLWISREVRDAVGGGMSLFQGGEANRGRIRISSAGNISIEMLEKADLSTFIHEVGHFYSEVLHQLAPTTPSVKADLDVLRSWVRAEEGKALTVDQQEQIARGFESYIMEGRAPTQELQSAFSRMKAWMLLTYRSIKALKVNLTDEVRQVFDRLLASEEDIQKAQDTLPPLFPTARDFMPDDEAARYEKAVRDAHESASMVLEQRRLADVKREYTKQWKEARAKIRSEVAEEVNNDPVWRALAVLQRGTLPDGSELPEGMAPIKLDANEIIERYGERQLVLLPKPYIYSRTGGIGLDQAAELLGFDSGDALIKAMPKPGSETPRSRVERITDERMKQEFGDRMMDGKAAEDAMAAVHNEDRSRLLHMELAQLAGQSMSTVKGLVKRIASRHLPVIEEVRLEAERTINEKKHRDIRPNTYLVAEKKAAKAALDALLKGDVQLAFENKQRELLNHELYRAAVVAKEKAESTSKYLSKFQDTKTRARIGKAGGNYLDLIDTLLERFDFAPASIKSLDRRVSLLAFSQEHPEADIPEELLSDANRKNWQDMTVNELNGLRDTIAQIAHLAKTKNRLLKNKSYRDLNEAASAFVGALVAHSKGERAKEIETRLPGAGAKRSVETWFASHRKLSSFVRQFDGFVDGGPIWQLLERPLNDAADAEATENQRATQWLHDVFLPYAGERRSMYQKVQLEGTDVSLSKMGQLMVALNWGNEVNRQRLMNGYGWTEKTVQSILDSLEDKDWDFVERVWDNINGYWPELERLGKMLNGLPPEKVEASPFNTKTGRNIRGGYFPISFDDRQSQQAFEHRAEALADRVKRGAAVRSTTEKGMLKERVKGAVKQEVRLDFGVIFEHVSEVIHTLTHTETLMDVSKVLRHPDVMAAVKSHYGDVAFKEITRLLDDIAAGNTPTVEGFEDKFAWLRSGATIVGLGFNVTTAMLQPFGLANSIVRIGPKWVGKGIGRWTTDAARMENTAAWIHEVSPFMNDRHLTMMREIAEIRNDIGLSSDGPVARFVDDALQATVGDRVTRQGIADSFFWMIGKAQMVADIPTWLGQYEKMMESGEFDEATCIALADQAVKDSQGGGQTVDLARVQRGGPLLKAWTTFYSYFNMVFQQLHESTLRHAKLNPVELGLLAVDFALLVTVPSALGMMVRDHFGGGQPPDDKDWSDYFLRLGREQLSYLLGTMLFTREISSFATGMFGYSGPAGGRIFGEFGKLVNQAQQGELDKAFWKSLNKTGGIVFHYPAVFLERFVTGLLALSSGDTKDPTALLFGHRQ